MPEPVFAPVSLPQRLDDRLRVGNVTVIGDRRIACLAFGEVSGGVAVAFGFRAIQRVLDHGAAQQHDGKRMRGFQRYRHSRNVAAPVDGRF